MNIVIRFSFLFLVAIVTGITHAANPSPSSPLNDGVQMYVYNDYLGAEAFFLKQVNDSAMKQESKVMLGRIYLETAQYDKAIDIAEEALKDTPNGLNELLLLASAYCDKAENTSIFKALKLGRKCISMFDQAAAAYPNDALAVLNASSFYLEAPSIVGGSKKKGNLYFDALMEKFPEYAKTYQVYRLKGDGNLDEARALALELCAKPFSSVRNQYEIAQFLKEMKSYELAKKLFKPLTNMEPTIQTKWWVNDSLLQLGEIIINEGIEIEVGISLIKRYKQRSNNMHDAHYYWSTWSLAKGFKAIGNIEKYKELVNRIKAEDYEDDEHFAKVFKAGTKKS